MKRLTTLVLLALLSLGAAPQRLGEHRLDQGSQARSVACERMQKALPQGSATLARAVARVCGIHGSRVAYTPTEPMVRAGVGTSASAGPMPLPAPEPAAPQAVIAVGLVVALFIARRRLG